MRGSWLLGHWSCCRDFLATGSCRSSTDWLSLWGDFRLERIAVERFAEPPKSPSPVELWPGAGWSVWTWGWDCRTLAPRLWEDPVRLEIAKASGPKSWLRESRWGDVTGQLLCPRERQEGAWSHRAEARAQCGGPFPNVGLLKYRRQKRVSPGGAGSSKTESPKSCLEANGVASRIPAAERKAAGGTRPGTKASVCLSCCGCSSAFLLSSG